MGWCLLILILVGFAILYSSLQDTVYDVDQIGYVEGARSILRGEGYRVPKAYSWDSLLHAVDSEFRVPIESPGTTEEVRPILYGYVLAGFMALFGTDARAGSILAFICGLWSLALVFYLAQRLAGVYPAALVTILTGISYFFWRASISVMTEALSMSFALSGAVLFLEAIWRKRPWLFLPAGAFYGLATATRPQQVVLLAASVVAYFASRRRLPGPDLLPLASGMGLFAVSLLPQYFYVKGGSLPYSSSVALFAPKYFWQGDAGVHRPPWQLLAYVKSFLLGGQLIFPLASIFVVVGIYLALRYRSSESWLSLTWLLAVFALLSVERYFSLRYLAQAVVPAYLLAAGGYEGSQRFLARRWGEKRSSVVLAAVAVGVAALAAVVSTFGVLATVRVHEIRAAPFEYLKDKSTPDDILMGIGTLGRFHHPGPFFDIQGTSGDLKRVVAASHVAGKRVFVVCPTRKSVFAEVPFAARPASNGNIAGLQSLGGKVVWAGTAQPPFHKWLPKSFVEKLSEGWAVYLL